MAIQKESGESNKKTNSHNNRWIVGSLDEEKSLSFLLAECPE